MLPTSSAPRTDAFPTRTVVTSAVAAAGAVAALLRFGLEAEGLVAAGFVAVLVVLTSIDLAERRLPNRIVLPAAGSALASQIAAGADKAAEWILASVAAAGALLVLALVYPGGLGLGDVKLALLLGAVLGQAVVPALVLAFVSVVPVAVYLLLRDGAKARSTLIPFGPFLAFGAIVVLLAAAP